MPITRSVVMLQQSPTVDIYPLEITLETDLERSRRSVDMSISKSATVSARSRPVFTAVDQDAPE